MRFEELLDRHERGSLTQAEAGEMLGMSERTFRRWRDRHREKGAGGYGTAASASRRRAGRRAHPLGTGSAKALLQRVALRTYAVYRVARTRESAC